MQKQHTDVGLVALVSKLIKNNDGLRTAPNDGRGQIQNDGIYKTYIFPAIYVTELSFMMQSIKRTICSFRFFATKTHDLK